MTEKLTVLFLCTGNSCRSQMAEGLCRDLWGGIIDSYSCGVEKHGLNPLAVESMAEIGIDIGAHVSKTLADLRGIKFDYVITVCGHADEHCPIFPGDTKIIHEGFDDPPKLAADATSKEAALAHYRRVRDEIKAYVATLPDTLISQS